MKPDLDEILTTWVRYGTNTVKDSQVSLYTVSETLSSEIQLLIHDKSKSEYMLVPYEFTKVILTQGYDLITWSNEERNKLRMLENHPTKYSTDVSEVSTGFNKRVWIKPEGAHAYSEGIPVLSWSVEGDISDALVNTSALKSGWRLALTGAENKVLAFAPWDDVDGIKTLIEYLHNPGELFTMLALSDPPVAQLLTTRVELMKRAMGKPSNTLLVDELKELLIANNLMSDKVEDGDAKLDILSYNVSEVLVPLAISIRTPLTPYEYKKANGLLGKKTFEKSNSVDNASKARVKAQKEWERKLRALFSSGQVIGWRIIDLEPLLKDILAINPIWVTSFDYDDLIPVLISNRTLGNRANLRIVEVE